MYAFSKDVYLFMLGQNSVTAKKKYYERKLGIPLMEYEAL
jgi:hypothetical protein